MPPAKSSVPLSTIISALLAAGALAFGAGTKLADSTKTELTETNSKVSKNTEDIHRIDVNQARILEKMDGLSEDVAEMKEMMKQVLKEVRRD